MSTTANSINTNVLTWEATQALLDLDRTFVGTPNYLGLTYFWAWEFRHALRPASYAVRRRVHTALLREGLEPYGLSRRHAEIIGRYTGGDYYVRQVERIEELEGDPRDSHWWDLVFDLDYLHDSPTIDEKLTEARARRPRVAARIEELGGDPSDLRWWRIGYEIHDCLANGWQERLERALHKASLLTTTAGGDNDTDTTTGGTR